VARIEDTPLTALQLHQATLHVDPRRVLHSIPSWSSGFTIRAKSGMILAEPKIQLKDLNIEGTCDTCARGKLRATGSRHTSHQRDNCRRPACPHCCTRVGGRTARGDTEPAFSAICRNGPQQHLTVLVRREARSLATIATW
jgi:hypothetical protein